MEPEPLKNKIKKEVEIEFIDGNKKIKKVEEPYFDFDNIKSAVEWLIEMIKPMDIPKGKNQVLGVINKAFEDVIKKD